MSKYRPGLGQVLEKRKIDLFAGFLNGATETY